MRRLGQSAALVAFLLSVTAWRASSERPLWIRSAKSDDSICMYRIGESSGQATPEQARQAALENATAGIIRELLVSVPSERAREALSQRLAVRNAQIVPDGIYVEPGDGGYACWVLVAYPLLEKKKLLEQIEEEKRRVDEQAELDGRMEALWETARTAASRGDYDQARTNLLVLVEQYAAMTEPAFDLEEAQLLLGDVLGFQKDALSARRQYETIIGVSSSEAWKAKARQRLDGLPKPPRFWPLHDRWGGAKVALCCRIGESGRGDRPFSELSGVMRRDCREARLAVVDVAGTCGAAGLAAAFASKDFGALAACSAQEGAGVLFAAVCEIDPAKKGKSQDVMGVSMPVPDTRVRFVVADTAGRILCEGEVKDVAGDQSESRLAERFASVMIQKHLVPKCAALASR